VCPKARKGASFGLKGHHAGKLRGSGYLNDTGNPERSKRETDKGETKFQTCDGTHDSREESPKKRLDGTEYDSGDRRTGGLHVVIAVKDTWRPRVFRRLRRGHAVGRP